MIFKTSCEKANHICDKSQYHESSFLEKVKLNIHLIFCRVCREYTAKNQRLTRVLKNAKVRILSNDEKVVLKEKLFHEMKK